MHRPNAGEVWLVDTGYKGKTRPAVVISRKPGPGDRVIYTIVIHTTRVTGSQYEVAHTNQLVKSPGNTGVFNAQGIMSVAPGDFIKKISSLNQTDFDNVISSVRRWLDL